MKLSPIQEKVMKWASGGWSLYQSHGSVVTVNGSRICNRMTIDALVRKWLLQQVARWEWKKVQSD